MPIPPLRPLDAFPYQEPSGRKLVGIRDPLGVFEGVLGISPEAFFIASNFDGERDAAAIAGILSLQMGGTVRPEVVERVREIFSERGLLQDATFAKAFESVRESFARLPARPFAHANDNYPEDPAEFRRAMNEILESANSKQNFGGRITGLIAPHIDFGRGMLTYSHAYGALRGLEGVDRFIILGTSHGPTMNLLAPTRKDYNTPLGALRTDRDAIDRVARSLGNDAFDDEFAHKNEHSIEFQSLFLKLLFPEAEIVPILCGSLMPVCENGARPGDSAEVDAAVEAIRAAMNDTKRSVIVAGADLAHVGPRFGGPPLTAELLDSTEAGDRESLARAAQRDAEGWFETVAGNGDSRNTCGLSPIYLMLRALDRGTGHLLDYRRCESADQCVTIGAMAFVDGPADSR